VLLVEQEELLPLRETSGIPIVLLKSASSSKGGTSVLDTARCHGSYEEDQALIDKLRKLVPQSADLLEPLDRVKEALTEALRAAA